MTQEQLEKANVLTEKIKKSDVFLKKIQSDNESDAVKAAKPHSFEIKYPQAGTTLFTQFGFTPDWLVNEDLKTAAQAVINHSKDKLIEIFEKDLNLMRDELAKL